MERIGDSMALLRDDKAGRNGPLELIKQLIWPPEPTGFRNLTKVLPSRELCSF